MIRPRSLVTALSLGALALILAAAEPAGAVSQWSRKYGEPCSSCHTAFPRINYYGEKFMRNGFQVPEQEPDGDTKGKERANENVVIDAIGNWFGARINLDLLEVRTNDLPTRDGTKTRVDIGNPNWVQLFVAGSIFKNTAIFIESELEENEIVLNWFHFLFTNLADSYVNFQVGKLSSLEWTSYSNRLRQFAPIAGEIFRLRSSLGRGVDSVDMSSAYPGIQYYGWRGPWTWSAGVRTGSKLSNQDEEFNYWGGLRFEITEDMESTWEGSNFSLQLYRGTDTLDPATSTAKNDFWRVTPAFNLRNGNWDIQTAFIFAHDDNITLAEETPVEGDYWGFSSVGTYVHGKWLPGVQFDYVKPDEDSADVALQAVEKIVLTPQISWLPRENFRFGLYAQIDLHDTDNEFLSPERKHRFLLNFRTMF